MRILATKKELAGTVRRLRRVGRQMAEYIESQMHLFDGSSTEFDGSGEPRELLEKWRRAIK